MTFADFPAQQSCTHCGECARGCPEALDPEALFFALVDDAWPATQASRLEACTECNRCVEVCPSHIPLLDWFRWGKAELAAQKRAALARARFEARNARLGRQRGNRALQRGSARDPVGSTAPTRTISKQDVLAAIARGKARRHERSR